MSRSSRAPRSKRTSTRPGGAPARLKPRDGCDCLACAGGFEVTTPSLGAVLQDVAELVRQEDPLGAQLAGAVVVAAGAGLGQFYEDMLVTQMIPQVEATATTEAMALLLGIGSVAPGVPGTAASTAAGRLADAGVTPPLWADKLRLPVVVGECWWVGVPGVASMLTCSLRRAGRSTGVVVTVDDLNCGAASEIGLTDEDDLPQAFEMMTTDARARGLATTKRALAPADFRWHVEQALDSRAVNDGEAPQVAELPSDDGPGYAVLAVLLRAWLNDVPMPANPPATRDHPGQSGNVIEALLAQVSGGGGGGSFDRSFDLGRAMPAALPRERRKTDPSAPIYQIKVGLRGTKPPIWRRLEVPADISLARLHAVIQAAFDWYDSHLHVFETPYGSFGTADKELGHRAEAPVTLEQVAPGAESKISYTYDFGDDWEHDIVVEKILPQDRSVVYPRCTGGRRAAPPEDCGGVWGYADLVATLADPTDPEHEEKLEWLGLDRAADFDPAYFDAEATTGALSTMR